MVDTPIVSESLQKNFRDNFPSQISSGRDLHVSDIITPIVDFSTVVGTSGLPVSLQQAFDFSVTTFLITSSSSTIISTPGFYTIQGVASTQSTGSASNTVFLALDAGTTTKKLIDFAVVVEDTFRRAVPFSFIFFLNTGISLIGGTNSTSVRISGSLRQIADISGTLVNPSGYTGS